MLHRHLPTFGWGAIGSGAATAMTGAPATGHLRVIGLHRAHPIRVMRHGHRYGLRRPCLAAPWCAPMSRHARRRYKRQCHLRHLVHARIDHVQRSGERSVQSVHARRRCALMVASGHAPKCGLTVLGQRHVGSAPRTAVSHDATFSGATVSNATTEGAG